MIYDLGKLGIHITAGTNDKGEVDVDELRNSVYPESRMIKGEAPVTLFLPS